MYRTTRSPMMQPLVNSGMGMAPFFKVTVFEQEHFQGKCLEFTSECCNIQECGLDNIRSIRVESGAWVGFEHHDFQGQQFILERGEYPHWDAYSGSLSYHVERLMSLRPVYCASHKSSRMIIFEKENFMGHTAETTSTGRTGAPTARPLRSSPSDASSTESGNVLETDTAAPGPLLYFLLPTILSSFFLSALPFLLT
eukprot:XP_011608883.1 PREDICTED: beta-crystallin A3-2-like isoform X2 [Takifugu rubripes]